MYIVEMMSVLGKAWRGGATFSYRDLSDEPLLLRIELMPTLYSDDKEKNATWDKYSWLGSGILGLRLTWTHGRIVSRMLYAGAEFGFRR